VELIEIMTPSMIDRMRASCELAAECLVMVGENLRVGMTTDEINTLVHEWTLARDAYPAPLDYKGFPKSVCTSPNEVVCHGIPGKYVLKTGDILNVDVTNVLPAKNGYFGDTSATFYIGEPSREAKHVTEVSRRSLELGIEQVKHGARIGDIGAAIQEYAEKMGCSVVREYVGHGIGRKFHTAPQVPHFGHRDKGTRIKAGMVFTIEPMINLGHHDTEVLADKWTVLTRDRSLSAQFEHTILVTREGCEVLTTRKQVLRWSEDRDYADVGPKSCPAAWAARHPG
jgi:methionyl aminopeptidase